MRKSKHVITISEFRKAVKDKEWFVCALLNKVIDYWNFNICLDWSRIPSFAVRENDKLAIANFADTGYTKVVAVENGIILLRK